MGPRLKILNVAASPLIACILSAGWAYGQSAPLSPSASPFQSAPPSQSVPLPPSPPPVQSSPRPPSAPPSQSAPRPPSLPPPTVNRAPIWLPGTTIEFVEGVPAVVSMLGFVRDPDSDPLVITLQSGSLWPGFTWHPTNYTIAYDGRPMGAKVDAPIVAPAVIFSADDGRP